MFAMSIICSLVSIPSGGSRMSLCDVNSAFVRSLAAAIIIWFLVDIGIRRLYGNHFTVSHM